jgi:hypothetical protein
VARAEGSLARQLAEEQEARLNALCNRVDKAEASMRAEVERTHAQFVDTYGSWVRGPLPSKCSAKKRAFTSLNGCKRSWG